MDNLTSQPSERSAFFQALGLAWQLGYTIAVPLVLLALGGRLADKYFNTSPWLLLTGVLLSIGLSGWLIVLKTRRILSAGDGEPVKPQDHSSSNPT